MKELFLKVAIALSGGVDSAVAAFECIGMGFECIGVTMKLPGTDGTGASTIAEQLKIPLHIFDACGDFQEKVIKPFAEGYIKGGTPNPCVDCNREVKFGALLAFAQSLGAEKMATGHYARVLYENERYRLKKAADLKKDQSYYLYNLGQGELSKILFPLGKYTKTQVRDIARKHGFINAEASESQDICFIPDGDYAGFIEEHTGFCAEAGVFTDLSGKILGQHKGHIHYTIGQRKGLGIAAAAPLYVLDKNPCTNTVTLGGEADLYSNELNLIQCNWHVSFSGEPSFRAKARLRYRQSEQPATVLLFENNKARIKFDEPQRAIAKGQHAVVYDGDTVLGGGVIA
jgi:tRNA-specific 2-thiouridylase